MRSVNRIVRIAYTKLCQRRLPHGLIHWRYALPRTDSRVRGHANLWWQSRGRYPRLVWLIIEFWLWFRWVTFFGWLAGGRAVRQWADVVESEDGISRWQQIRTLIKLSIGCCVPPHDVYSYRLFGEPDRVWDFVFDQEISSFHRSRSLPDRRSDVSRTLLVDKLRHTQALTDVGVPMTPILACASKGQASDLLARLEPGTRLFCKTRTGNRGIGAFAVWKKAGVVQGRLFSGQPLANQQAVCGAWHQLCELDDALVQPALVNHPLLAEVGTGDDLITVRYISQQVGKRITCFLATLEVPIEPDDQGRPRYVILPIDSETGHVGRFPSRMILSEDTKALHDEVLSRLPADRLLPDWGVVVEASRRAHKTVPGLWAVAWDWALTPSGALLLEGNSGWAGRTPQMLQGGFLRAA